ncbi:UDP-glucose/GDP-mannose dehydrogenase family protein [bacterium]|nr:UDP-glucose/GDP-mannose dehydrogenase family protein [bacterium]
MKVAVIGAGYVGLVTGVCLADFGNEVICVDIDPTKVATLMGGKSTIYEPGLDDILLRNLHSGRLSFTTQIGDAVSRAQIIFIAVNTPASQTGDADLTFVMAAADQILEAVTESEMIQHRVIVTKSTVPVGTGRKIMAKVDDLGLADRCSVVSNPEFLREGSAIDDCLNPDRIVIGTDSSMAFETMLKLYHAYCLREIPCIRTSIETAELCKYAANGFLAAKISFINELSLLCERVGADVLDLSKAVGLDRRIGNACFMPGPGFGGSCFPKDVKALDAIGTINGMEMYALAAVTLINQRQKQAVVEKVRRAMNGKPGRISVWGLAFKANTDDMRDAPALDILPMLLEDGHEIRAYDPVAMANARAVLGDGIIYCASAIDAARGADLVLLLTEWREFYDFDLGFLKSVMDLPRIIDVRNVLNRHAVEAAGFSYDGLGR